MKGRNVEISSPPNGYPQVKNWEKIKKLSRILVQKKEVRFCESCQPHLGVTEVLKKTQEVSTSRTLTSIP